MTRQRFDVTDQLLLQVEALGTVAGALPDLVRNPDGTLGGWAWLSPVENTTVDADISNSGLILTTLATQAAHFSTEFMPVESGTHVLGSFRRVTGLSSAVGVRGRLSFYDVDYALISETAQTALVTTDSTALTIPATALPAGTAYIKLRVDLYRSGGNPSASDWVTIKAAHVVTGTSTELAGTITLDDQWLNILGSSNEINVDRAELNLGTLTATIVDADLDPSQSVAIRTGKRVRLIRTGGVDSNGDPIDYIPEPVFTGTVLNAKVSYTLTHPDAAKRARIQLTAVDQAQPLANTTRSEGVAAIDDLPYVFEGCGVPWNVNGNTGHTATTPAIVSTNENAKAVDQVAITRDSNLGYAWFDRRGVVQVWDAALIGTDTTWPDVGRAAGTVDESVYNPDVVVDYDTDRCINSVTVKYLRTDPATGESTEVDYGPYVDRSSIARWGTHAAEFTAQGINDDETTIAAYAASILAANATPAVRIVECTIPLNTTADLAAWALLDLYDLPTVANTAAGINEPMRITRLSHRISGGKWLLVVGFTAEGGVAQPQVTPSPPTTKGATLSELLRPVGEVTMWYGNPTPTPTVTTNLATQPSFETSVSQWAIVSGSTAPAQSSTRSFAGSYSMLVARGAGTSTLWASNDLSTKTTVSQTYTASARLWVPASNPSNCGLRVAGTSIVGTPIDVSTALRDQWVRVSVTFTRSASGTAFLYINGGASGQVWVDEVTIFQGSSAGPEFDGDTPDTEDDLQTIVYAWTGTPYASTSTKTVTPKIGQIPAGWLLCDGSAFSGTDYPELAALLGTTTTPNMVDVFPIGAGTKALGTNGGNPTKTIAEANLPAHTHGYDRRDSATAFGTANSAASPSATGTLVTGNTKPTGSGTPLDVMNPWRALHFIIRAR